MKSGLHSGGGSTFLRVLTEELLPDIDRRYRTSDDRTLTGFSLAGLFGAYALFQAPNKFRRMILAARPSTGTTPSSSRSRRSLPRLANRFTRGCSWPQAARNRHR
jgi:enterochelin esterase-like enzyme